MAKHVGVKFPEDLIEALKKDTSGHFGNIFRKRLAAHNPD